MEKIEVDNRDRPIENIFIQKTQIFVDPFQEADEQLEKERADELEKQRKAAEEEQKKKTRSQPLKVYRQGIGKYLNTATSTVTSKSDTSPSTSEPNVKKKKNAAYKFDNFSSW